MTPSINWEATDAISWNLCYVCVCSCALNIFKTTERAADCKRRSVICFLNARNVLPSEIHHQICQVYGDNVMNDGMVRKWVRMFNEGRENVHHEAWNGRPTLENDDLVHKVNERVRDDRRFTITDLPCSFLRFQGLYSMTMSVVANIAGSCILWGGYKKNLCPATISASIMAVNMWKNSLKNVESDNNTIL